MSETPVPDFRREFDDEGAVGDFHARELLARRKAQSGRPVSAFSSSATLVKVDSPPSAAPGDAGESSLVAGLQAAGMLRELSLSELDRIIRALPESSTPVERRLLLLEAYYGASSDAVAALRRRATDRWFIFSAHDNLGAPQLVQRLLGVLPEIAGAHLERVGSAGGALGTLVLRLGEHVCAIDDDIAGRDTSVSVQEIVRAMNVLLERKGVRARLVGLFGDGSREAYVGLPSLSAALALVEADFLTAPDVETLMALTAW
jgi:hypothetical protein